MILLIGSTLLSFLSVHPKLVAEPVLRLLNRSSKGEHMNLNEIKNLKSEQQKLNMVDNFAEYSKIQRKINKLTESLQEIRNTKSSNNFYIRIGLSHALRIILILLLLSLSIYYRSNPVFYVDSSVNLTPFGYLISFPNNKNSVSCHFWVMCCTAVAKLIKFE